MSHGADLRTMPQSGGPLPGPGGDESPTEERPATVPDLLPLFVAGTLGSVVLAAGVTYVLVTYFPGLVVAVLVDGSAFPDNRPLVPSLLLSILGLLFSVAFLAHVEWGPDLGVWAVLSGLVSRDRIDHAELTLTVYGHLPERDNMDAGAFEEGTPVALTETGRVASGRPRLIATRVRERDDIDPDTEQVEDALSELEAALSDVHSTADGRYYREKSVGYDEGL